MTHPERGGLADALVQAAKELGQVAREERETPQRVLEIVSARAQAIAQTHSAQLFHFEHRLEKDPAEFDGYFIDPLEQALFRALLLRIERGFTLSSFTKVSTYLSEARKAVSLARARRYYLLAAEISRDAATVASSQRLYEESDAFLCAMRKNLTDGKTRWSLPWVPGWAAFLLAGYGYRPYNLAVFIAICILVLSTVLAVASHWKYEDAIVEVAWNYLAFGAPPNFEKVRPRMGPICLGRSKLDRHSR